LLSRLDSDLSYWCFPPPRVVTEALFHFEKFGAEAVMVVPVWPNSSFFSVFWPDGVHFARFVLKQDLVQPFFLVGPLVTGGGMRCSFVYILLCTFQQP